MKMKYLVAAIICGLTLPMEAQNSLKAAWGSTDIRYIHNEKPEAISSSALELSGWRGERVNGQFVVWNEGEADKDVSYTLTNLTDGLNNKISSDNINAGFVETVLTDTFAGCGKHEIDKYGTFIVADMIDNKSSRNFASTDARGVWMTIQIPQNAVAGTYSGSILVENKGGKTQELSYSVQVLDRILPAPSEWNFHLDLWQNPYAVARVHELELWSEAHFDAMRPYMLMLASAGQKVITTTLIDKPWNSQTLDPFGSMVSWIKKTNGEWVYDFAIFDKWVEFMMDCGITQQIACYSMIPWNLSFQYFDEASNSHKYVKSSPGKKEYNEHWGRMLEAFAAHLKDKSWFDITCIAMDERALDQMQKGIGLIHEKAPGLKISLAGNNHPEIEKDLYDYCVDEQDKNQFSQSVIERRRAEGKKTTYYTCCSTNRPNTYTFSDPAEAEFLAWYAIQKGLDGYLRWAYNSWTLDPVADSRFTAWSGGDTYFIYPEARSSIRWERLIEGIQAFEKYHILKEEALKTGKQANLSTLNAIVDLIDPKKLEAGTHLMINKAKKELNAL